MLNLTLQCRNLSIRYQLHKLRIDKDLIIQAIINVAFSDFSHMASIEKTKLVQMGWFNFCISFFLDILFTHESSHTGQKCHRSSPPDEFNQI